MTELENILNSDALPTGLDFVELYRQGIRSLEKLSGKFWNDFDLHDPGVSILEQLCYSLVDLSFRSSFDVEQILLSSNRELNIFQPSEIFTCNTLTSIDIRKQLIHDIPELNNVWVLPVSEKESSFKGIYDLWLDLEKPQTDKEELKRLRKKVRKAFCRNRNLCEDLSSVRILKPLYIKIYASIEIDDAFSVEDVYAEILFKISNFFRPSVGIYSFDSISECAFPEQIYEGPALKEGYIKDEELTDKPNRILVSDLIKLITDVEGVNAVQKIQLGCGNEIYDDQIIIPEENIPYLQNIIEFDVIDGIFISSGNFTYKRINIETLNRKLNILLAKTNQLLRLKTKEKVEKKQAWEIDTYTSIQNDMPEVYGIGELGLRNSDTPERKAGAKQLKAYLLLFEQIMANYLSQLSNIASLFSYPIDEQSYNFQFLEKIPRIKEVLMDKKGSHIQHPFFEKNQIPKNYKEGLPKLIAKFDDFIERQNRFMDFLLAINGEKFYTHALKQTNTYYNKKEFELQLLKYKQGLLFNLTEINKNRSKAYDYLSEHSQHALSGLQTKTALLLGFESHFGESLEEGLHEPFIADSFINYGFELVEESKMQQVNDDLYKLIEEKIETEHFDYIDPEDFPQQDFSEKNLKEILSKTSLFESHEIYPELFKEGPELKNYLIGKIDHSFALVFQKRHSKKWLFLGKYATANEASITALALVHFFKKIGIHAEGMYLVEHILLRPRLSLKRFGLYLVDQDLQPFLYTTELYTYYERIEILEVLKKDIYDFNNYAVEECGEGLFEVVFTSSDKKIQLKSIETYESVELIYSLLEKTFEFLSDKYEIIPFSRKTQYYVKYKKPKERIPEDFFSYKLSIILPNWTNRFSNMEFRKLTENLVRQLAPAYISIDFYWLPPQKIKRFEHSYLMWKEAFRLLEKPEDNVLNKNMVRYLFDYKKDLNHQE